MNAHSNSMHGKDWRRIKWAVLGLVCAAVVFFIADGMWTLWSANRCFRMADGFTPGRTTLSEARTLLRYRPFVQESTPCTVQDCSFGFAFEERLSRWALISPERGFQGHVHVRNGTVETIHFFYAQGESMPISVTVGPTETPSSTPGLATGLSIIAVSSERHKSVARLKNFADLPIASRRQLLKPNLWCLIRIRGCETAASILPGAHSLTFE